MCKTPIPGLDPFHLAVAQDRARDVCQVPTDSPWCTGKEGSGQRARSSSVALDPAPRLHTFQVINRLLQLGH